MFANRFFGARYFGPSYWGKVGATPGQYFGRHHFGVRYFGKGYWGNGNSSVIPPVTVSQRGFLSLLGAGS